MQQNATGSGHSSSRVQFPEQLLGAEIPRPPSTRPLPRIGSHNRDPSIPWPANEGNERTRTSSIGSSHRPEGIGLGRPSRSPVHVPSPLNPATRRGSGHHIHRKRDSSETFDASKYDFDNAFGQTEVPNTSIHLWDSFSLSYTNPIQVATDHSEGIARLAQLQRKRRKATEGHRSSRQEDPNIVKTESYSDNLKDSSRGPRAPAPSSQAPSSTLVESSRQLSYSRSATVRSDTPSSQEHSQDSACGQGEGGTESDELWTSVFQRGSRGKGRSTPLTEQQYNDLEKATDERIAKIRAQTSSAGLERARTTADQLQRRYDLIFPSLAPGETPFNLMDVIRWRREKFAESLKSSTSGKLSREAEIEKKSLSWRPHLTELHDPKCPRYRSRIYAPWHLTACLMEESLQPHKPVFTASPLSNNSPVRAAPPSSSENELRPPSERVGGGDISGENDSNQSGGELFSRGLGSLRRFKKSLPGPSSKSVDLSPRASPHHSKASISSLHLFGSGGAISPSSSRAHINKLFNPFSPPKPVGEQSDDGHLSGSANEKEGYASSGPKIRVSGNDQDRLGLPLSEEERSQRSSDEGKASPIKRLRPRNFFTRDETVKPITSRQRAESAPIPVPIYSKPYNSDLDLMSLKPDPNKRLRRRPLSAEPRHIESHEEKEEEIEELDHAYTQREQECMTFDKLIKDIDQEQHQLLQLGREYLREVSELKRRFHLDNFALPTEHDFRILTESNIVGDPASEEMEARELRKAISEGVFAPPLSSDLFFDDKENLDGEFTKIAAVEKDLDFVARIATDHVARSKRIEAALKSLKTALGEAFSHSSQVYREIISLETLVAASRPVPTWKRISNSVKPMLSWGVTILTWFLKFLGEIGRIVGFFLPPFLKNLFGWEMLSGQWPTFVFVLHLLALLALRRLFGLYWSFETGLMAWIWPIVLLCVSHPIYSICAWYNREVRYYVLNGWWEGTRSPSLTEFMRRHWWALILLLWIPSLICGMTYWLLRVYL
ncbi:hypothetical protein M408DRAFT_86652 [Serendipita vermifera MAFF 305830]|uniref:Uncharacterized protein n=1 Tax=Serendipita vermifera MAFF 305830 TaxID=933852 RepID=A0A0C3BAN5_SERVB|nr:hypothetical protein M408DRAFT_86652 [Serendipita vermifera MAFF 305830]